MSRVLGPEPGITIRTATNRWQAPMIAMQCLATELEASMPTMSLMAPAGSFRWEKAKKPCSAASRYDGMAMVWLEQTLAVGASTGAAHKGGSGGEGMKIAANHQIMPFQFQFAIRRAL